MESRKASSVQYQTSTEEEVKKGGKYKDVFLRIKGATESRFFLTDR